MSKENSNIDEVSDKLLVAVQAGNLELVETLLKRGDVINYAKTTNSYTSLLVAVANKNVEIVKLLLGREGVNVNTALTRDGVTPLFMAAQDENIEIVKLLLAKNADVNYARTRDGATPLLAAVANKNVEIVKLLLGREDIDVNKARISDGATPLLVAANKSVEIVKLLLGREDIDVNKARISDGATPLIMAVAKKNVEIVKLLLEKNANPNLKWKPECNVLYYASNNYDMVTLLINAIYESDEVNRDQDSFVNELQMAALAGNNTFRLRESLVSKICKSKEPLSAKALDLLILANPDKKDLQEAIGRCLSNFLPEIKTLQMANYASKVFAGNEALNKIPANLSIELNEIKAGFSKESNKNSPKSLEQDLDSFAKRVAKNIYSDLTKGDSKCSEESAAKIALASYLDLKTIRWESLKYVVPSNKQVTLDGTAKKAATLMLANSRPGNINQKNAAVSANNNVENSFAETTAKIPPHLPTEMMQLAIENLFFAALQPNKDSTIFRKLGNHISYVLTDEERGADGQNVNRAAEILQESAKTFYDQGFKEVCKAAVRNALKEIDVKKEVEVGSSDQNPSSSEEGIDLTGQRSSKKRKVDEVAGSPSSSAGNPSSPSSLEQLAGEILGNSGKGRVGF